MKKRITALIVALITVVCSAEPVFADNAALYNQFKSAGLSELRSLFVSNFTSFDISTDGNSYNDSQKSLIILEAYYSGFDSFDELNQNVTDAASKLMYKKNNPNLLDLSGYSNVNLTFDSPTETDAKDTFEVEGKGFIVLDEMTDDNGEPIFFVMAKDYYGTVALDPDNLGRWDDSNYRLLPYKLTNSMAFGSYSGGNLPESILRHLDILHEWNVEPGSGTGFTNETTLVAPISIISATEYKKYGEKIGLDSSTSRLYWTRTPVKGDAASHFTVNTASPKTMSKNKGWGGQYLRPVFYLKGDFFKEVKLDRCGANVTVYLDNLFDESGINALYSQSELKNVFGSLSVEPLSIIGNNIVGETLTADFKYEGAIPYTSVGISWMRSTDKTSWQIIAGATAKSYTITSEDAGHFIRAAFSPVFDSVILKNGEVSYTEPTDSVYTDASILAAIQEIDSASDVNELRQLFVQYEPLLHCDASVAAFPDSAAEIFMADNVRTVQDVVQLYHHAIALDDFKKATDDNMREKAESEYLLGFITEYSNLNDERKNKVITNLFIYVSGNIKVSEFIDKAKEYIMIERFNNAERYDVIQLLQEYSSSLGINISSLSAYQLEKASAYIAGIDFGTDINQLKSTIQSAIANVGNITAPSGPIQGSVTGKQSGGYIQPVSEMPTPAASTDNELFTDLGTVSWAVAAINNLAKRGVLDGNGDGTFSPGRLVTRNEFVKMIVTAFNIEHSERELTYEDIKEDAWSREYIASAVDAEIISGMDDTHFGDGLNITREDAAVISERVMKHLQIDMKSSNLKFTDSNEISDYAVLAVSKMKYCGIMSGISDDIFAPKDGSTRAMAAVIINNLLQYYENALVKNGSSDTYTSKNSFDDKYDLLLSLGIFRDEFLDDDKITRGELAAMLAMFRQYNTVTGEQVFDDVSPNHKYYKEIAAVYRNKIMSGITDTEFAPDDPVTYGEAYNAVIDAVGYKDFPEGKREADLAIAKQSIHALYTDELTTDIAKKLFYAALEIPVLSMHDTDNLNISEQTILNYTFNAFKARGVVNAVAGVSLGGRTVQADNKVVITVDSKDYLYTADGADFSDYLGYEVTYYYQETDNDSYRVLIMYKLTSASEPLRLSFDEIDSAKSDLSELSYKNENKTRIAKISKAADFIYNGRKTNIISSSDLAPNNGYVTLIDGDDDGEYDVVKIDCYEYIMVGNINASERTILDRFTLKPYSLDDDAADKIRITKNNRDIKLEDLSKDDVLAIAKSRDRKLLNAYVSDQKITGILKSTSPSDWEITLDDMVLKCVKDFDFSKLAINRSITVGLDWNGYVVGFIDESEGSATSSNTPIGYLYGLPENEAGDSLICTILTQNNEYVSPEMSKDIRLDGNKVTTSDVLAAFTDPVTSKFIPQLIAYDVADDGKISRIYTSHTPQGVPENQTVPLVLNKKYLNDGYAVYNNFGITVDFEYNMLGSGVLFDVTLDNGKFVKTESSVTKISSNVIPASSKPENLYVYNSDKTRVSKLCVYEHESVGGNSGYKESFSTQVFVINSIKTEYVEADDELKTVYIGYHSGNEVKYTVSDKLKDSVDTSKLKKGDVLLVWLTGTKINRFRRIYTHQESNAYIDETDLLCNYGDHNYTGNGIVRGGTNWDYPYDWAQHIIERAEGKSGSTAVGGTRWLSVLGSVDLVYKSDSFSYPIIRLTVAGKTEPCGYTMDANTKVYEYDTNNDTITVLDPNNLTIYSDKVVLTARYGNVRDVIVYKD